MRPLHRQFCLGSLAPGPSCCLPWSASRSVPDSRAPWRAQILLSHLPDRPFSPLPYRAPSCPRQNSDVPPAPPAMFLLPAATGEPPSDHAPSLPAHRDSPAGLPAPDGRPLLPCRNRLAEAKPTRVPETHRSCCHRDALRSKIPPQRQQSLRRGEAYRRARDALRPSAALPSLRPETILLRWTTANHRPVSNPSPAAHPTDPAAGAVHCRAHAKPHPCRRHHAALCPVSNNSAENPGEPRLLAGPSPVPPATAGRPSSRRRDL